MELLVLVMLGGVGLATLVSALRSQGSVPRSSVDSFRRSMAALGRDGAARGRAGSGSGRSVLVLGDPQRVVTPRPGADRRHRPAGAAGPARRAPAGRAADGWVATRRSGPAGSAGGARPRPTSAAQRRAAVMRALVGAVAVSAVAWAALGAIGAVLLAVSLLVLVAYFALLASVRQQPAPRRRSRPHGRAPAAAGQRPAGGRPAAPAPRLEDDAPAARGA